MRQGGQFAGHYTPMIAKKLVEGASGKAVDSSKAGIRTKEEFQNQFKTKKPEKPIDWKNHTDKKVE